MTTEGEKPKRSAKPRKGDGSATPKPKTAAQKKKLAQHQAGRRAVRKGLTAEARAKAPGKPVQRKVAKSLHPSHPEHGRPTRYSLEVCDLILKRIAAGATLTEICEDTAFPAASTVVGWDYSDRKREADKRGARLFAGFSERYTRARELRLDIWEERLRIASTRPTISKRKLTRLMRKGAKQADGANEITTIEYDEMDDPSSRRLEIDTLKWLIANERSQLEIRSREHLPRDEHGRPIIPNALPASGPGPNGSPMEDDGGPKNDPVTIRVLGGFPVMSPGPSDA